MNASTIEILLNEGITIRPDECCICYEKFIDINACDLGDLYEKILEENKYNVTHDILLWSCASNTLSYDDRFECLTCKNKVCYGCIMKMEDPDDDINIDGSKDNMEMTGRITCPMCKTKDFRLKFTKHLKGYCGARGGVLPEEIIYDIKNISNITPFNISNADFYVK
jgi:hypothetical protein